MNNCKTWDEYFRELQIKYPNKNQREILNIASKTFKELQIKNTIIPYYCEFIKYTEKVDNDKPYNDILRETISYLKELKKRLVEMEYHTNSGYSYDIRGFEKPIRKRYPRLSDKDIRAIALKRTKAHKAIRDIIKFWQDHIMGYGGTIRYKALQNKLKKYGRKGLTFMEYNTILSRRYNYLALNNGEILDHIIIFLNYVLDKEENNLWPWKRLYYNARHMIDRPCIYLTNW